MTSNYPPGFGSAADLDHVEGPVSEEDVACPWCGGDASRATWHSGGSTITCDECGRDEDEPDEMTYAEELTAEARREL